jgi:RNA polymerase sigma-70 factor (ECF subfamily)
MDRAIDGALVERLRRGDSGAFDEAYEAYRARLFGFLARLGCRRDLAEDLAEEVWVRLVAHARRLDPDTRLPAWLFTVARNLYWSHCRSRRVEEAHSAELMSLWTIPARYPSPFEGAVATEVERRVERALASLPASYREVLLLVALEDLTPTEAATVCGITPEALRKRLSRARAMLAGALRDDTHGPRS